MLQSRFGHVVELYLTDGVIPPIRYKCNLKSIHNAVVARNKESLKCKALGTHPPENNPEEATLPRVTQRTFSQLRSTYCDRLKNYQYPPPAICVRIARVQHKLQSSSLIAHQRRQTYNSLTYESINVTPQLFFVQPLLFVTFCLTLPPCTSS
jgi:hypothetical protein